MVSFRLPPTFMPATPSSQPLMTLPRPSGKSNGSPRSLLESNLLRAEFHAPQGPRGRRGSSPIDKEIEERLRERLQGFFPAQFCGEECTVTPGTEPGWVWLVDPHDGTYEYTAG